jgi:transcriptional regulator with XRE-family HTH domain
MSIGHRVRKRREIRGLTQHELAAITGIAQTLISRIERGVNTNPGAEVLKRLAIALHCSIDYLVDLYDVDHDDTLTSAALARS